GRRRLRVAGSAERRESVGRDTEPSAGRLQPGLSSWRGGPAAGARAVRPRSDGAPVRGFLRGPGGTPGCLNGERDLQDPRLARPGPEGSRLLALCGNSPGEVTTMRSRLYFWRRCLWDF